jgi:hypothetical protein
VENFLEIARGGSANGNGLLHSYIDGFSEPESEAAAFFEMNDRRHALILGGDGLIRVAAREKA